MKIQVLVSILCLLPFHLFAHDTLQYTVRQYTDENGLPQNSVKSMGCDRSSFLWMLTENGVVRFDGQNFRSFNKNQLPLASSRMSWLIPDLNTGALIGITEKNQFVRMQDGQAEMLSQTDLLAVGDKGPQTTDDTYQLYNALGLPNIYANLIQIVRYKISRGSDRYFILSRDSIIAYNKGNVEYSMKYTTGNYYNYILLHDRLYQIKGVQTTLIEDGRAIPVGEIQGDIRKHPGVLNGKVQPKIYWSTSAGQAFMVVGTSLYLLKPGAGNGLTTELLMHDFDYEANRILTIYYDTRYKRIFMGSHTRGLFVFTRNLSLPFVQIKPMPTKCITLRQSSDQMKFLLRKAISLACTKRIKYCQRLINACGKTEAVC